MIFLLRDRTPGLVHSHFVGAGRSVLGKRLLEGQRNFLKTGQKHKWLDARWKVAKEQLLRETGGKCAYCEASHDVVSYGDVEHYRPKSVYWWLAYTYDNYLASCQLCNQQFKSNNFPVQGAMMEGPPVSSESTDEWITSQQGQVGLDPMNMDDVAKHALNHEKERPLLLNPYFDDPASYLSWSPDDDKAEVRARALTPAHQPFLEAMEAYYGINRPQLSRARYSTFALYRTFRFVLQDLGISEATRTKTLEAVERMVQPGSTFSGMLRYFETRPHEDLSSWL